MKTILIPGQPTTIDIEEKVFGQEYRILAPNAKETTEISDEIWSKADAILAWHDFQYDEELIAKLKYCKVIVRIGVGYDNVDLKAAKENKIIVCNIPDYGTNDVADHAIGLMLTLARGIYSYSENVRSRDIWDWKCAGELHRLTDSTMGIIGLGRIGTATTLRAKAFGMNIVFYDPYIPDGQDKALGVRRCDKLVELLEKSDIVSIHTPLTKDTKGMADFTFFNSMKKGAIFINTARGEIIELDALTQTLRSNHLSSAGLDVLPKEPPDQNHPLIIAWRNRDPWISERLIITPHSAFYNIESYQELRKKAAEEAKRVLEGKKPKNCVN